MVMGGKVGGKRSFRKMFDQRKGVLMIRMRTVVLDEVRESDCSEDSLFSVGVS